MGLAAAPGSGGRHPLPTAEGFALQMGAIGIGDGHTVVAYDDVGGSNAARLYVGSWSGWIADPARPGAVGAAA